MPPRLLILNDDVLYRIADHLLGWDALSFSLTSKRVYDLAIHRVAALIECKDRDKLWSLHRTLFYDNPERAKHIQIFIIRGSVFPPEELYGSDEEQQDDWEVLESPVAPLIVELLRIASNIRHLTIECFDTLQASDPGVTAAMAALSRLSRVELFGIRWDSLDFDEKPLDETQPVLRCLRAGGWALTTLSLELPHQHDFQIYPALLSSIAAFPRLVTLRIIGFYPRQSFLPLHDESMDPSFPSVQKLFLTDTTPYSFDLVRRCPNALLVSTCIADGPEPGELYENAASSALGSRRNRLRSLILSSEASMYAAQTLLDTAFHLEVSCQIGIVLLPDGSDRPGVILLLDTLKKVSPVWAQLSVAVGMDPRANSLFVTELAAPRLRFLTLKIHLDMIDALFTTHFEGSCWLDGIWDFLCSLPLVCLRLHLAKIPRRVYLGNDGRYGAIYHDVSPEDVEKIYNIGASIRRKLPLRCANAIPTLKYIAVADEEPSLDNELNTSGMGSGSMRGWDWESADERYGGRTDEYEYQSEWYAEKIKTLRWWRVERSVKKRWRKTKLRPLTPEKGKAVQKFIEETDFESIERIDELFS